MNITAIDLYCGVGGLTHGLQSAGINVVEGYDIDEKCRFPYETNNNSYFVNQCVSKVTNKSVSRSFASSGIRLLAGCAPCQPFSNYTQALPKDARWGLIRQFARLVSSLRPELVTMENVPEFKKHTVFDDFIEVLEKYRYHVSYGVVFCPDYGIPQKRKRLVLLASQLGDVNLIPASHTIDNYVTLQDCIGSLPRLQAGSCSKDDILHRSANLSEKNKKRILASKPGGSWRDWPESLLTQCHRRSSGKKYTSIYGRMEWLSPSPTITTQFYNYGSGRHGHPSQTRAISLREAALLQTFPRDYMFVDKPNYSIADVSRMIGNAVPVKLAEAIGKSFVEHVNLH